MRKTIFRSAFLAGALVVLLCAGLFFALQIRQTLDETYLALQQEAVYAEHGLMLSGEHYLETLGSINRITWITASGDVLFDSEFTPPLSNQMHCPEVSAAVEHGEGQGIRRSESSGAETMYYARRCEDGTVLRLSRPMSAVRYAFLSVSPVFWVLLLVLMIAALLSFRTARQIVRPINELDLEDPEASPYPELTPLVHRILEQKRTIQEQSAEQERMRREFSANVSHELKTPLTSISGFAELMAGGDVPPEMVAEFSSDIYRESQRMISLIDDIIRLSRLDEGELQLQKEPVDLYALASETLDSLQATADRQHILLQLQGSPAVISGVWQLLSEALYNLCDNAIKYNQPGGTVTVEVSPGENGGAALSVSDTGIGISPDQQGRVFERFYRVDKSHSRELGGTGLGLSIVKHVAQLHHAELTLNSYPGEGSRFTLVFPPA